MSKADEMLKKLGYEQIINDNELIRWRHSVTGKDISISLLYREIAKDNDIRFDYITMEELEAINEKCRELGWIKC